MSQISMVLLPSFLSMSDSELGNRDGPEPMVWFRAFSLGRQHLLEFRQVSVGWSPQLWPLGSAQSAQSWWPCLVICTEWRVLQSKEATILIRNRIRFSVGGGWVLHMHDIHFNQQRGARSYKLGLPCSARDVGYFRPVYSPTLA